MANKIIFIELIVALLQVASAEQANPDPYMDDVPLTIYVDAGKEIDQFLSLAKSIDGKQSVLEDALERITQKVSKLERKLEELRNQQTKRLSEEVKVITERMSAEVKATEERCTQEVSKLERKLEDLINLQTKSSEVATLHKRPAELACEKMHDLRSAGIHNNTKPYIIHSVVDDRHRRTCDGVLIEKRFVLIITYCLLLPHSNINILEFSFSDKVVSKKIKKVHPSIRLFDYIHLVELDSDVDYNYWLYPTCLYTSELNPKSGLMNHFKTIQIVEDSNCFGRYSKELSPFKICVEDGCSFPYNLVFFVEEKTTPQLFGFLHCFGYGKYQQLYKVFPYLYFIESIVWPKNGK